MSLFKRPRKPMQPRVFSSNDNDDDLAASADSLKMDVDVAAITTTTTASARSATSKPAKSEKKRAGAGAELIAGDKSKKPSLLSFDDEDEDGEIFQVRKSSHSKKVMKKLDKERRKKRQGGGGGGDQSPSSQQRRSGGRGGSRTPPPPPTISSNAGDDDGDADENSVKRSHDNSNSIQTEIRTDDFVLVLKNSELPSSGGLQVLNGRAALCAGRDDMSDDDDADPKRGSKAGGQRHRFAKPDNFKTVLESGAIPDAAMIHAARKRRQKAREEGDSFIPIEEKEKAVVQQQQQQVAKPGSKGRLVREDGDDDDDGSDEERVDMSAINGAREREERREKFYSVQQELSGDDTDPEMAEWENQQIRKGVTGAQLVTAQQESIYGHFMMRPSGGSGGGGGGSLATSNAVHHMQTDASDSALLSTGTKLEQAYARSAAMDAAHQLLSNQKLSAPKQGGGPRMPSEVQKKLHDRLQQVRELHSKHLDEIEQIGSRMETLRVTAAENEQNAPVAAVKYRFYQELRGYVTDLVECLDEKLPAIVELERRALAVMSRQAALLLERRRQDVRDQAKEIAEAGKPGAARKMLDDEDRVRRTSDREGRRTRRRQIRERTDMHNTHMDGMSSDDEIHEENGANSFKTQLDAIDVERQAVFDDVSDDFSRISSVLEKFEEWRRNDFAAYNDTYFSICLPKILGPMIRLQLVTWNPLDEQCPDLERQDWYAVAMRYGWTVEETEETLAGDPDVRLVPVLIEKIVLPKITEIVDTCWDPLSSAQTLKLVVALGRLGRDYPALKPSSKYLRTLFATILDRIKGALDHDVFIPIFPKQLQEARSSFFQRQFSSALKLLRNILSWQGILADEALKSMAIATLLNRNLMMAMRVCSPADAVAKASIIVNTLPRVWLHPKTGHLESVQMLVTYLKTIHGQLDVRNPLQKDTLEKVVQVLHSLHADIV